MRTRTRRWTLIIGSTLIVVLIAGFAAFQFAIQSLKGQVEKALGPQGEVKEIRVGLTGIEVIGIRIRAPRTPQGTDKNITWPAEDELRAERIRIVPAIRDLLSARVGLRSIRVEGAYISMLRPRDGRMRVLPSLLQNPASPGGTDTTGSKDTGSTPPIRIGEVELVNGTIEFFDATIRQPPHKLRLEQINASIGKLELPDLKGQSPINLTGVIKGVRQDGKISISGTAELATRESRIVTRLRGVDLVAFQPYLLKATESGVKKGSLDFDLDSSIQKGRLHAPGSLTLSELELASTSTSGTIMGMPRNAAISIMKGRNGKISVKFVLEGDINDPRFSLNEHLMTQVGASIANTLGVSIGGLAKGVESIGSGTEKSLGDSLGKLFRK